MLGGWLADEVSWRWVFFMKVPVGIFALVFSARVLRSGERSAQGRFDVAGFVTGGAGLALLLVGLERGARIGWSDLNTLGLVAAGVALAIAFVVTELRTADPMIDLSLFRDRMFAIGNMLILPAAGAAMGAMFVVPLMLQTHMGLNATESGLVTAAQAVGMLSVLPFTNRLFQRFGPRRLLLVGFTLISGSQLVLTQIDVDSSLWMIRGSMFVLGMAGALSMVPLQAATFARISMADTARASAVFSTSRQVAASVGVALLATVLTVRTADRAEALSATADAAERVNAAFAAYHDVFLASVLIGLLGIALSLFIRDAEADASRSSAPKPVERATVGAMEQTRSQ